MKAWGNEGKLISWGAVRGDSGKLTAHKESKQEQP